MGKLFQQNVSLHYSKYISKYGVLVTNMALAELVEVLTKFNLCVQ